MASAFGVGTTHPTDDPELAEMIRQIDMAYTPPIEDDLPAPEELLKPGESLPPAGSPRA